MHFLVDARNINHQPRLRVLNAHTGVVLLEWELHQVRQLMQSGDIPEQEFLQPQTWGMKFLVKNLFLLGCIADSHTPGAARQGNPGLDIHMRGRV